VLARFVPIVGWLPRYKRDDLRSDLAAGFTTAVMIIPQAMGYAMLAGLPPIVGLYAALTPVLTYALLGTSRQLSVGPVAMDSLLVAAAVGAVAKTGSDEYLAVAMTLGTLVGIVQLSLGLVRMGFVVNFLSRPVISGFTSAAALIIGASQLKYLLKIELPNTHHVHRVILGVLSQLAAIHTLTLLLGAFSVGLLVWLKRKHARMPGALFVVLVTTGLVYALGLVSRGVRIVGEVPSGLPHFQWPRFDLALLQQLLPSAVTIALVSFMEAISVGKHFARENRYDVEPSQELVALGSANLVGGMFGAYPVAGGFSRSAVNASAGAKTQLAALVTVSVVALTLLFLTPLFHYMPEAALAAIILTAVIGLIDVAEPKRLWRMKRIDLALLLFTFAMTLSVGIQWGIVLGVGASLVSFIVQTTRPHVAVLGQVPGTEAYLNVMRHRKARELPGVLIVRVDAQFYFGNVSFLKETLRKLEQHMSYPLKAVVLDASGMNQLDSSAEAALGEIDRDYAERGVYLLFARVKGPVRDVMHRSGLLKQLNEQGRIFFRTHDAAQYAAGGLDVSRLRRSPPDGDPRAPAGSIGCGSLPAPEADTPLR
jgi:SulP family sulfate permease